MRSTVAYWSAVVRRVAPVAGLVAFVVGGAMLAASLVGDGAPVASALGQSALAGLICGVAFLLVVPVPDTVAAARTASHYGLSLEPAAARLPAVRRVTADTPGVTAFQLADSVLHTIKKAQTPVIAEVLELGHGKVSLICGTPYGPRVQVSIDIDIAVTGGSAVAVITCRPTTSWKRLDSGASWVIAGTLERHVRAALTEH
ncbi:hypothetical protein [Streptomyces sp. SID12501]|uniref:DUF1499 domain-containing protein n=1 Tax=Streptomyces sp. SID12501 TaxID=2706042 RepID=A0A6B3C687_9ACTN|nr:hypothetical protein [Streptomyces sp. SID12501]NEC91914.1 hypothetical protein [Streptomyces sp. SID12501]